MVIFGFIKSLAHHGAVEIFTLKAFHKVYLRNTAFLSV